MEKIEGEGGGRGRISTIGCGGPEGKKMRKDITWSIWWKRSFLTLTCVDFLLCMCCVVRGGPVGAWRRRYTLIRGWTGNGCGGGTGVFH